MRTSQYLLSTLKETPADAEVISHQLMLRAGMIRKLASGLYTWLPTGVRVLKKVENIVREEMNNAGAIEVSMPVVQPADLWQESGRWEQYGPELLRFVDRGERPFVLGPTHEEVITDLIRNELSSYKQLPLNFYQIQTKLRDEVRPRISAPYRPTPVLSAAAPLTNSRCWRRAVKTMWSSPTPLTMQRTLNWQKLSRRKNRALLLPRK